MTDKLNTEKMSPFSCDMDALAPEERPRHLAAINRVFSRVENIVELPNGYAFLLADDPDVLLGAAEFISRERLCCPFFGFSLDVEPEGGFVSLQLTGRDGVKPFIQAEIGGFLPDGTNGWTTTGYDLTPHRRSYMSASDPPTCLLDLGKSGYLWVMTIFFSSVVDFGGRHST
jgi:hypothetical protein